MYLLRMQIRMEVMTMIHVVKLVHPVNIKGLMMKGRRYVFLVKPVNGKVVLGV
tara:strand:+ start:473 stop:631 length:159 start_codon:yes stop_codon:yes gene_type:complete